MKKYNTINLIYAHRDKWLNKANLSNFWRPLKGRSRRVLIYNFNDALIVCHSSVIGIYLRSKNNSLWFQG